MSFALGGVLGLLVVGGILVALLVAALRGSWIAGILLALCVGGGAYLFYMPMSVRSRPAHVKYCKANLKDIGNALRIYQSSQGKNPSVFTDLFAPGITGLDSSRCICPSTGEHYLWVMKHMDMNITNPSTKILAYEPRACHEKRRNVLFADGHVELLDESRFQALFAEQGLVQETELSKPVPELTAEQKAEVEQSLLDLASPDEAVRVGAEKRLLEIGSRTRPLLGTASEKMDLQTKLRIAAVLEKIEAAGEGTGEE